MSQKLTDLDNNGFIYDRELHMLLTERCNLRCKYCIVKDKDRISGETRSINIKGFLWTLKQSRKTYNIILSGGEPFLIPNFIDVCNRLSKDHFISIISNITSQKIKEFVKKIDPRKVIYIVCSLHIDELDNKRLINRYIKNIKILKKNKFHLIIPIVAYPTNIDKLERFKKILDSNDISYEFSPFIGKYDSKDYPKSYTKEEIKKYKFKEYQMGHYLKKYKICNAGYNSIGVKPNGDIFLCDGYDNEILGNIYSYIDFNKRTMICKKEFCNCPKEYFHPYLYYKALDNNKYYIIFQRLIAYILFIDDRIKGNLGIIIKKISPRLYMNLSSKYIENDKRS